jgi:hypothetical protein
LSKKLLETSQSKDLLMPSVQPSWMQPAATCLNSQ